MSSKRGGDGRPSWRRVIELVVQKVRQALVENAALKFVALVLAVTLFILVNTNKDAVIGFDLGVLYTELHDDRILVSEKVDQIHLSIRGSWRLIKRFDEREVERITVDLPNLRSGEYRFPEDAIVLPPGLTLLSIEPATMPLEFESLEQKTVPVHIPTLGRPQRGYKFDRWLARPSQVTIRGGASVIRETEQVATRSLNLDGRYESFTETLALVPPRPEPIFKVLDSPTVEVEVKLVEERGSHTLEGAPIQLRPGEGVNAAITRRLQVEPETVDVTLHGPLLTIESFEGDVVAFVEVSSEDGGGRARKAAVRLDNVPEGVGVEIIPEMVRIKAARTP